MFAHNFVVDVLKYIIFDCLFNFDSLLAIIQKDIAEDIALHFAYCTILYILYSFPCTVSETNAQYEDLYLDHLSAFMCMHMHACVCVCVCMNSLIFLFFYDSGHAPRSMK